MTNKNSKHLPRFNCSLLLRKVPINDMKGILHVPLLFCCLVSPVLFSADALSHTCLLTSWLTAWKSKHTKINTQQCICQPPCNRSEHLWFYQSIMWKKRICCLALAEIFMQCFLFCHFSTVSMIRRL